MAQLRNRESRRKTEAELYILERFPSLIRKIRTDYRLREPESSAQSVSDPYHIIHWDSFLRHRLEIPIGQSGAFLNVMPRDWARAFIQPNLEMTTTLLCKAIFTKVNLQQYQPQELSQVVQRAVLWMLEKETQHLDPWSYPYLPLDTSPIPFSEEMEKVISQFIASCRCIPDTGCDLANMDWLTKLTPLELSPYTDWDYNEFDDTEFEKVIGPFIESVEEDGDDDDDNEPTTPDPSGPSGTDRGATDGSEINFLVFTGFVRYLKAKGRPINTAQIAAALTKATVTNNTDIFIDALQISNNRLTQAATKRRIEDIAVKLFNKIFRDDFSSDPTKFRNVEDICPIKLLAIYRGAKFLHEVWQGLLQARTSDFDSATREHNLFPNTEERMAIDGALNKAGWDLRDERLTEVTGGNFSTLAVPELQGFQPQLKHRSTFCHCNQDQNSGHNLDPLPSSSSSSGGLQLQPTPIYAAPATGSISVPPDTSEYVTKGRHTYLKPVFEEAVKKYKWESTEKAAIYLYKKIFTEEERRNGSPSGRGTEEKLSEEKMDSLLDLLKFMEENIPIEGREVERWDNNRERCSRRKVLKAVISTTSYLDRNRLRAQGSQVNS